MPQTETLHSRILRLARAGSMERAWRLLEENGLTAAHDDPTALTLRARLIKDRAKRASGAEAARLFAEASELYEQAVVPGRTSYPLINAATLSLLAGKRHRAVQLAQRVIGVLEADPKEAETRYWLGATLAEALLLLGRVTEARAALRAAVSEAPLAWEDRAATIGQFALICGEIGCDMAWLDQFRPPRSVQYSGLMAVGQFYPHVESRLAEWLENENVGFGFGALAAGADIWIAEALVRRGASLNVVLPCPLETFRSKSVAAVDPAWLVRFDRLIEAADSVDELDSAPVPSPAAVSLTEAVSLGLAIYNARMLQSEPLRLRVASEAESGLNMAGGSVRGITIGAARRPGAIDFSIAEAGRTWAMLRGESGRLELFDSLSEAFAAARSLTAKGEGVALDYRFASNKSGEDQAVSRIDAIAEVVEGGQILASKAMAFALLAEAPQVRVEMMGEIRAVSGFFPLYALG